MTNKSNLDLRKFFLINCNVLFCSVCEALSQLDVSDSVVCVKGHKFFRSDSPSGLYRHGIGIYIRDNVKIGRTFVDLPEIHLINFYVILASQFGLSIYALSISIGHYQYKSMAVDLKFFSHFPVLDYVSVCQRQPFMLTWVI